MTRPIAVVGAGGHARVVVSLLRQLPEWSVAGILDRTAPLANESISGVIVHGTFADLALLPGRGIRHVVLAIGDNRERRELLLLARAAGLEAPVLVHPRASVEPGSVLGAGTFVGMQACVGADVVIGEAGLINTGAIVDHECRLGVGVHVAPGARIAGRVILGDGVMIGIGATVRDKVAIGAHTTVGAGAVVLGDLPANAVAYGVPAKVHESI